MIIYGCGNFNRRDHSVVRGVCASCGHRGYLESYTSSKFFTLYFIPVLPLGRQRIVEHCPRCRQARGLSCSEWRRLRNTHLPRAIADYEAKPADPAAAKELLGTAYSLQDRAILKQFGPRIQQAFSRNVEMLTLLAGTYSYLCMDREADSLYLQVVGLTDDPAIAAEADAHVKAQQERMPRPPNRLIQSLPVLIVPAAVLLGLATYLQKAASSGLEEAYLVNGLNRTYSVLINGEKVTLRPHQYVPAAMLRYGENQIEPTSEHSFIPAQRFRLDVPWHRRPFDTKLAVVNPDEAAVMIWERSGYSSGHVPDSAYTYDVASGRVLHAYDDVDFPFTDFPSTITVSSRDGVTYRYRVSALGRHELYQVLQLFPGPERASELQHYVRARLRADDADITLIHAATSLLPAADFLALAEPRLVARPVMVEWHRAYQDLLERTGGAADVLAYYQTLVAAEPTDSALRYLLSRQLQDPDERVALLRQAVELPNPSAYAHFGLCYGALLDGDFPLARLHGDEAIRLDPTHEQFRYFRQNALLGLRDYETLDQEAGDLYARKDLDTSIVAGHVYRLAARGQVDQAQNEITRYVGWLNKRSTLQAQHQVNVTNHLRASLALATRNRQLLLDAVSLADDPSSKFQCAVLRADLDAALALSRDSTEFNTTDRLLLYVLCARSGRAEDATAVLEAAISALGLGGREVEAWTRWLRGVEVPDPKLAAHVCVDPSNHGVFLTALACRHPERAADYVARATAQKYRESFYTLALETGWQ